MRKARQSQSQDGLNGYGEDAEPSAARRLLQRVRMSGRTLSVLVILGGVTSAIVFNAVVLQPARHPAPLFAVVDAARAVNEKPAPASAPKQAATVVPPRREAIAEKAPEEKPALRQERATSERAMAERVAEKAERPAPKPVQNGAAPAPSPRPVTSVADPLGELIRGGVLPPASIPSEPDARLLNVQKNLARLGYAVGKPDGLMGPGTRAAIEKFERSKKWTVTGEMSPQLVRELGTVSAKRD